MLGVRPIVQKLPLAGETSFIASTFRTPYFETPWHQHIEYEISLFLEGHGMCFVGNYVGEFKAGDLFLLGKNLPHAFYKNEGIQTAASLVVQFTEDFWGQGFLKIPETQAIYKLLSASMQGIRLSGDRLPELAKSLIQLESDQGFSRLLNLLQCLKLMEESCEKSFLSTQQEFANNDKFKQRLDEVFDFTIRNFQQRITLEEVAAIAHLSVTAFCRYFKKSTQKSYVQFLTEIRIGYACQQLQSTDKSILEICYESGFNSPVNFNKQFFKLKKTTPRNFRMSFLEPLGK
ncbi:AraC family transcriptional regulator [Flavihumibacter sp. CACIAM 22H1]|uniref:AraC family transcriptional regulator n=1 Tax=Flavihumibacter sp. CACIAM 22H1 TaxID=1812911 RepID=UPI0007A8B98D|nr:AraC family transcriptional regulator [Flavihumibacter sp. CACIAM 22H1]KYP12898.1 MAG: AraC family transcriptional regulator [Flavihumibacter sp. CACIAM 22H1]